jgi:hypothetical protein
MVRAHKNCCGTPEVLCDQRYAPRLGGEYKGVSHRHGDTDIRF